MFWLSEGEEIMTLAFFLLIRYRSVTDDQTDGRTDIPPLAIPAVCIARYANALVKIIAATTSSCNKTYDKSWQTCTTVAAFIN